MSMNHEWPLWSADQIIDFLPELTGLVKNNIDKFSPEHQSKNQAALQILASHPLTASEIREGQYAHELATLGFALDVLGRQAASQGNAVEGLRLYRAAHELFRSGNPAIRPTAPMRNELTNALKILLLSEVKRIVAGESDAALTRDMLERFVLSAWGTLPPQLSLSINEMLFTALERARAAGEHDVTFHERFVRDNIEAILGMEIPSRLESVRSRWEEIGEHVAPAAVRVAHRRLRRPESLSELLPREAWERIQQAVERGDAKTLAASLEPHYDTIDTNLRLHLDAKADYREPAAELRFHGGADKFFLEARDLLLRRDPRALQKFSNIHFNRATNPIAKEWYAYALSVFGSAVDIHEILTLLEDAVKAPAVWWTARWNLACALRKIPDRAEDALDVLLPVLDEDAHGSDVFELCLLWALEQHRDDELQLLFRRAPYYEAHLLAALRDFDTADEDVSPTEFREHFRRIGRILRDPDRRFPDAKENLAFRELDQLTREFIETSLVEAGVEWFRQRVSYGNEARVFKNWECAALLNERAGDLQASWRCRVRQWSITKRNKRLDKDSKTAALKSLLVWAQRNGFEDDAVRMLREGWRDTGMPEADVALWEQRLQKTAAGTTPGAVRSSGGVKHAERGSQSTDAARPSVDSHTDEQIVQKLAPQFASVSSIDALAAKHDAVRELLSSVSRKHSELQPSTLAPIERIVALSRAFSAGVDEEHARVLVEDLRGQLGELRRLRGGLPYELHGLAQACERVIQNASVRIKVVPDITITPSSALKWTLFQTGHETWRTRVGIRLHNPAQTDATGLRLSFMVSSPAVRALSAEQTLDSLPAGAKAIVEAEIEVDETLTGEIELRAVLIFESLNVTQTVHISDHIRIASEPPAIPVTLRYVTLAPVGPERLDLFHGRERELTELASVFAGGRLRRLYFVNGIRRVGKSTLIRNLGPRCGPNVLSLIFSLETLLEGQRLTSIQLVRQLCRAAAEQSAEVFGATLNLPLPGAAAFELDPPWTVFDDYLHAIRDAVGRQNVLLCFDEVQRLIERIADEADPMDDGFLSWMRGKIQTGSDVLIICTGSEPFAAMRRRYSHTLWGNMEPYNVSFVDRKALGRIATLPVVEDGVTWLPEALDELWLMTEGHPWITQMLAEKVCEALNLEGRRVISPGDVQRAADRISSDTHVSELWWNEGDGLVTATHRQIAFLILQHQESPGYGLGETQLAELSQWSGIRTVGKYLDEMRGLEILSEVKDEHEPRWRIRGRFLERHVTLLRQRALQEASTQDGSGVKQRPLAVMLDWENVKISLMRALDQIPDARAKGLDQYLDGTTLAVRLLEAASRHGTPRQRWAVADWDRATFVGDQKAFKNARYWTDIAGAEKANASDHVLLEKIHFVLRQHPEIAIYVIGTGDADFHEAIQTLQQQGKQVILWSTRDSISKAYGESLKGPDKIQIEWLEDLVFGEQTERARPQ